MPNPTSLLTGLYLVIIAASAGAVYAILTQGGELLAFIPRHFHNKMSAYRVNRRLSTFQVETLNPIPWWLTKAVKLSGCGKCIAGQFALWLFFPLIGYQDGFTWSVVLLHFGAVTVSILLASILILYVGSRS